MTILVFMMLKYLTCALSAIYWKYVYGDDEISKFFQNDYVSLIWMDLYLTLGPIYHWIYASQYLKTCFLTSGIVSNARLLLERHRAVIDNHIQ